MFDESRGLWESSSPIYSPAIWRRRVYESRNPSSEAFEIVGMLEKMIKNDEKMPREGSSGALWLPKASKTEGRRSANRSASLSASGLGSEPLLRGASHTGELHPERLPVR